jgi:hypothetical protein
MLKMHIINRARSFFICGLLDNDETALRTSPIVSHICVICYHDLIFFIHGSAIKNAWILVAIRISIIVIRMALAGDMDMGDIADKHALPRLDDIPVSPASLETRPIVLSTRDAKDYFGFLTS